MSQQSQNGPSGSDVIVIICSFFVIAILVLLYLGVTVLVEGVAKFLPGRYSSISLAYFLVVCAGVVLAWIMREVIGAVIRHDRKKAYELARIDADKKAIEDATALKAAETALANLKAQIDAERQQLREEVELEWQRDTQAEIEREHARYLRYVDDQRIAKAQYEAAKKQHAHTLVQLEEFVLAAHPEFVMRTDPAGVKGPEAVSAAFRKHLAKKLPEAGILRRSKDAEVLAKIGPMVDFPPAPAPINPPVLIPVPENLRKRFEGVQVRNYQLPISL